MTTAALQVAQLVRDFPTVRALDGLSFEVPPGIVFGFLGPNGAGKTTVLRVLLGLLAPTSGATRVVGLDPVTQGTAVRARTGALLEHAGLYERLSAAQNLDYHARIRHLSRGERTARIRALLDAAGLWERRDEPVGGWSRGMKQKLAVARAVLHRPPLVFLDEPTAGLDPVASAALRDDLARLARDEGTTIFLTTHHLAEAEALCAQVAVIRRGRLLDLGAPAALRDARARPAVTVTGQGVTADVVGALARQPGVRDVRGGDGTLHVTLAPGAAVPPLVAWLVAQGVAIEEVRRERPSLEEAFLGLVAGDATGGGASGGRP